MCFCTADRAENSPPENMAIAIDYSKWDKLVLSDSDDDGESRKPPWTGAEGAMECIVRDCGCGLRQLARVAQTANRALPPRVCYVGGSVTAQAEGWRPRFHSLLEKYLGLSSGSLGHTLSAMGNVGSKVHIFSLFLFLSLRLTY